MTIGNIVFQTPWRNFQGCECRITTPDWKLYSFHVGNPYNIVVSGFTSSVDANIAMRLRITALKALSKKPEPVEEVVEDVAAVAAVIPIESKRRGRPPKHPTYSFTSCEDAALVPAVATEDW